MRRVTKENLITQIDRLYKIKDEQGQLSMNGEYTLQAYKMLLVTMEAEPVVQLPQVAQIEQFGDGWDSYHEDYYLAKDVRTALTTARVKWCSADGESQYAPAVHDVLLEIMGLYDDDPGFASHTGVKLAEKLRTEISRGNK